MKTVTAKQQIETIKFRKDLIGKISLSEKQQKIVDIISDIETNRVETSIVLDIALSMKTSYPVILGQCTRIYNKMLDALETETTETETEETETEETETTETETTETETEETETEETETEETETTETETTEQKRLKDYCIELADTYNSGQQASGELLYNICRGVACSVLRKCEQAGAVAPDTIGDSHKQTEKSASRQSIMRDLIREIYEDREKEKARLEYLQGLYRWDYNDNGDLIQVVCDGKDERTACKLVSRSMGDGSELVHVAIVELLEQVEKQRERGEEIDLFSHFTVRELSKKVVIRDGSNAWRDRDTCILKECFRAVRRAVYEQGKQREQVTGYSYIKREETDSETGATETYYNRLPHYYDNGSEQVQRLGDMSKKAVYSANQYDSDSMEQLINSLGLTDRQSTILHYRLQGFGERAIGTRLGISFQAVQFHIKAIQKKARDNETLGAYIREKITF